MRNGNSWPRNTSIASRLGYRRDDSQASNQAAERDFFLPELYQPEELLGLVLASELMVVVLVLADGHLTHWDWIPLAMTSLFVQWVVLLSAGLLCCLRPLLSHLRPGTAGVCCCLVVVCLTLTSTALGRHFGLIDTHMGREGVRLLYLRHGLIAAIISGLLLRYFYLISQRRQRQQGELKARIESLQARIRPHFLFNSLNSIASLISSDADKAEQLVLDLSDLFRASLAQPYSLVSWQEETGLARRYLSIEQYRCGDRLKVEWQADDVPPELPIPPLTLQPLLENAILHGIQPRAEGGTVQIAAKCEKGFLELEVINPCQSGGSYSRGSGQALANIQARLQALFGDQASLRHGPSNGRYITHLRYPFKIKAGSKAL